MKEKSFVQLFLTEWMEIFRNRTILLVMLIVPVAYFTLFGFLYKEQKVTELPLVIVDHDQSEISRELVRAFAHDQSFSVVALHYDEAEAMQMVEAGEAHVGVFIPAGLATKLRTNQPVEVLTVIDGSNMMIANTALKSANTIIKSVSAGVTLKKLEAKGDWGEAGKSLFIGIDDRYRVLYNPTFNYQMFLVFGLGGTVLQQVLFLGVSLSVVRDRERGVWLLNRTKYGFLPMLLGKMTPYLLLAMFNLVFNFNLLLNVFAIPHEGNLGYLLLAGFFFNVAVITIGLAISMFAKDQLQATQLAMLIALPSFMLSGYTWPLSAMPPVIEAIGKSLPLTYFLDAMRDVVSKGHGLEAIRSDVLVLILMACIGLLVACLADWLQQKRLSIKEKNVDSSKKMLTETSCN